MDEYEAMIDQQASKERIPIGKRAKSRKIYVSKHLRREANKAELVGFRKRVKRIHTDMSFEDAYHNRKPKRTLKKEQDSGKFLIPCCIHYHDLPNSLCDTGSTVSIMAIDTSQDSFTFVDNSKANSAGMIKNIKTTEEKSTPISLALAGSNSESLLSLIASVDHFFDSPLRNLSSLVYLPRFNISICSCLCIDYIEKGNPKFYPFRMSSEHDKSLVWISSSGEKSLPPGSGFLPPASRRLSQELINSIADKARFRTWKTIFINKLITDESLRLLLTRWRYMLTAARPQLLILAQAKISSSSAGSPMLTEAHRRIMLIAAYDRFTICSGHVPSRTDDSY
ncbi:hypothetical protein F2Q70_00039306 [Brassica cretica]|uniref:Uncharacterized protein n=1 Tax=Brassica cretica TaxID=69181 RepID=A0A8S9K059_BRACR|nr:hypothetical protein F2Q70_00039306 [Brassica cretica]